MKSNKKNCQYFVDVVTPIDNGEKFLVRFIEQSDNTIFIEKLYRYAYFSPEVIDRDLLAEYSYESKGAEGGICERKYYSISQDVWDKYNVNKLINSLNGIKEEEGK